MFTHSFQSSVFILFHCNILVSLFVFLAFFLCVWKTLRKTKNISCSLVYFPCSFTSSIKRKHKKISRSSFACWELSRVNSFLVLVLHSLEKQKNQKHFSVFLWNSFLFFGGREEKTMMKMLSGFHMHYFWSDKRAHIVLSSPVYWMLANSSLVQCTCTIIIIIIHIVRSCKWKGIMMIIWLTYWDKKSWYERGLSCFCKYD